MNKKKPITKRDNFDRNYMHWIVEEEEEELFKMMEEAEAEEKKASIKQYGRPAERKLQENRRSRNTLRHRSPTG